MKFYFKDPQNSIHIRDMIKKLLVLIYDAANEHKNVLFSDLKKTHK